MSEEQTMETVEQGIDYEKEVMDRTIANTKREIIQNREKIKFHEELLQIMYQDRDARLGNHDIMIASGFKFVNPQMEFQKDEQFCKNLCILQSIMKRQDVESYKANEQKIEMTLKVSKEALASLEDEYRKLTGTEPIFE